MTNEALIKLVQCSCLVVCYIYMRPKLTKYRTLLCRVYIYLVLFMGTGVVSDMPTHVFSPKKESLISKY